MYTSITPPARWVELRQLNVLAIINRNTCLPSRQTIYANNLGLPRVGCVGQETKHGMYDVNNDPDVITQELVITKVMGDHSEGEPGRPIRGCFRLVKRSKTHLTR